MDSWFGGPASHSHKDHRHHSTSHHSHSRARSPSPKRYFVRQHSPSAASTTSRGFWSRPHTSSSSYYKRRPRDGYISNLVYKIKRWIRQLMDYAKRNPMKLFMLVIVPLVTGGALHNVLKSMGVRLPAGLEKMMGGGAGRDNGRMGGSAGGGGGLDLGQVVNVAKMFM